MKNHRRGRKKNYSTENIFKIVFMIIPRHNLAENRETGMGNSYVTPDLVTKSLTGGTALFQFCDFLQDYALL